MEGLLGEVDTNILSHRLPAVARPVKTESRRKVRVLSPPISEDSKTSLPRLSTKADSSQLLNTPPAEQTFDEDDSFFSAINDDDMQMSDPIPSSPIAKAVERRGATKIKTEEDDDDMMEVSQAVADYNVKTRSVNISGSRPAPKVVKKPVYPSPASSSPTKPPLEVIDATSWNKVNSKLNVLTNSSQTTAYGKLNIQDAMEADGSLRMFWIDYTEVNGSLCLFGKVKDKNTGSYASAFVKVDNVLRKLFFLPREFRHSEYCNLSLIQYTYMVGRAWPRHIRGDWNARCLSRSRWTHDEA